MLFVTLDRKLEGLVPHSGYSHPKYSSSSTLHRPRDQQLATVSRKGSQPVTCFGGHGDSTFAIRSIACFVCCLLAAVLVPWPSALSLASSPSMSMTKES